jgi:hypothetical protein
MLDAFCFLVSFFLYLSFVCLWCGACIGAGTNSHKTCLTQPHFCVPVPRWYESEWVSEWLLLNTNSAIFSAISWWEQVNYQCDDDDVCFVLDQHAELVFYSASSLKQPSAGRHVAILGHIILIPSQPVFALSPKCCVLSREETNTNLKVFGFTRSGLEPTIYRTRGVHANHYATDAVQRWYVVGTKWYIEWTKYLSRENNISFLWKQNYILRE